MENHLEQQIHDTMVQVKSILLKFEKFLDIRANFPASSDKPLPLSDDDPTREYIPDITARGDTMILIEVETSQTFHEPETLKSWSFFDRYAKIHQADFRIVVPKGYSVIATQLIQELNIEAKVEEVIEDR